MRDCLEMLEANLTVERVRLPCQQLRAPGRLLWSGSSTRGASGTAPQAHSRPSHGTRCASRVCCHTPGHARAAQVGIRGSPCWWLHCTAPGRSDVCGQSPPCRLVLCLLSAPWQQARHRTQGMLCRHGCCPEGVGVVQKRDATVSLLPQGRFYGTLNVPWGHSVRLKWCGTGRHGVAEVRTDPTMSFHSFPLCSAAVVAPWWQPPAFTPLRLSCVCDRTLWYVMDSCAGT